MAGCGWQPDPCLDSPPPAASLRPTEWELTAPFLSPRLFVRISQSIDGAGLVYRREGPSVHQTTCSGLPAPCSLAEADRLGSDRAPSISAAIRPNIAAQRWGGGLSIVEMDQASSVHLVLASPAPGSLVEADRVGCDQALSISAAIRLNIAEHRWGGACPLSEWTKRPPYTSFWPPPPPAASWRLTEWDLTMPFYLRSYSSEYRRA